MKRCLRCGVEKPPAEFYPGRPGAVSSRCRRCHGVEVRSCVVCGANYEGKAARKCCSAACRRALNPPTYKVCEKCGAAFGPVSHLSRRFCSSACAVEARKTGRRVIRKTLRFARNAQSLLRYHVQAGHITRPAACEGCGTTSRKIEGAHHDYAQPLQVRWLCKSCHARWDKREPKGVTYRVLITPKASAPPEQAG